MGTSILPKLKQNAVEKKKNKLHTGNMVTMENPCRKNPTSGLKLTTNLNNSPCRMEIYNTKYPKF